ncbi:MAG: hypothetical protein CFH41_01191 [Alphaproteobacteria bacterium MarineAlpha11_Bin1]|nr:MAG: hypothetical protein CFH41_01191 [Alphaproteobacteria bacterium MarineAlpha11_Bin1]|tara:strand:- start:9370 stop:9687 length:318 start_codon:yes stop_codon:yes gene_type:complete
MTSVTQTTPGMATPEDLFRCLSALCIKTKTYEHQPIFSVKESMNLRGSLPGAHCNTLYYMDEKGTLWLCVIKESRRMNPRVLSHLIDPARLSFARPERVIFDLGV